MIMKKISQGQFEIRTTKADAIDKFMQMQGVCREELSSENLIEFYCSKKGKIAITNPPKKHIEHTNSTNLYAEIIEQDGKTYITYYTVYSHFNNVLKIISLTMLIVMAILAILLAVSNVDKTVSPIVLVLCLLFFVYQLFNNAKEQKNSPNDSKIMINELEKRVEAVNLWDK